MYVQRVDEHTTIQLVRVNPPDPLPGLQRWRYLVARELMTVARGVVQLPAGQQAPEVAGGILTGLIGRTDATGSLARAA